jgi:paired amphipathic helix protein Sin3a
VSKDTALGRHIEKLSHEGDPNESTARYEAFISLIYSLLDAGGASAESSEGGKYEDRVRCLLGNQSFELTTMDKLISHILKNLQHMANDDTLQNMIEVGSQRK